MTDNPDQPRPDLSGVLSQLKSRFSFVGARPRTNSSSNSTVEPVEYDSGPVVPFEADVVSKLKDEVFMNIFSFLVENELFFKVGLACKRFYGICDSSKMYECLIFRGLGGTMPNKLFKKVEQLKTIQDATQAKNEWRALFLEVSMCFEDSQLLSLKQMKLLNRFYGNDSQKWKLIYSAKRDGWKASEFHKKCDYKANTVTVIKSTNGSMFGGFTPIRWSSNETFAGDKRTFLFSLVNPSNRPCKMENNGPFFNNHNSIWCSEDYGPCFGELDIVIYDQANLRDDNYTHLGYSFKLDGYKLGDGEIQKFLTGSYTFTPIEIEVFQRL